MTYIPAAHKVVRLNHSKRGYGYLEVKQHFFYDGSTKARLPTDYREPAPDVPSTNLIINPINESAEYDS